MINFQDLQNGRFYWADCFDAMKEIPDGVVDMILCDLPYGTTACAWDSVLPFDQLWKEYCRVTKSNAAIVLTASQPFTTALIASNYADFRYSWVWEKEQGVNFLLAKKQPLKVHEDVCVFYRTAPNYNPQMTVGKPYVSGKGTSGDVTSNVVKIQTQNNGTRYPRSIQFFKRQTGFHPTQKPVALFEYLIKTYTNESELILDNTAGSGTTAIAAINTNRKWICIEKDEDYANKAIERIRNHADRR